MAAAITTTATTLEGQLAEIAGALQVLEKAQDLNRVALSYNIEGESMQIQATLPMTFTSAGNGQTVAVQEYTT